MDTSATSLVVQTPPLVQAQPPLNGDSGRHDPELIIGAARTEARDILAQAKTRIEALLEEAGRLHREARVEADEVRRRAQVQAAETVAEAQQVMLVARQIQEAAVARVDALAHEEDRLRTTLQSAVAESTRMAETLLGVAAPLGGSRLSPPAPPAGGAPATPPTGVTARPLGPAPGGLVGERPPMPPSMWASMLTDRAGLGDGVTREIAEVLAAPLAPAEPSERAAGAPATNSDDPTANRGRRRRRPWSVR